MHSAKESHTVARNRRGTRRERKWKRRRRGRFNFNFPIIIYSKNVYTVAMPFKCMHKPVSYNFNENLSDVLYVIKCVAATGSIVEKTSMLNSIVGKITPIFFS